jgi:hypothetical protein
VTSHEGCHSVHLSSDLRQQSGRNGECESVVVQRGAGWKVHCEPFCEDYTRARRCFEAKIRGPADTVMLGPAKFVVAKFC